MVTVKRGWLAGGHLHDHFGAGEGGEGSLAVMPGSLVIEGMAQTAGILVGHADGFRQKVILAKINRAVMHGEAAPGFTIRHEATIVRLDGAGASTKGVSTLIDPATGDARELAEIDLIFSHIDQNMAGMGFPEHNFVFGEAFRNLLRSSGVAVPA